MVLRGHRRRAVDRRLFHSFIYYLSINKILRMSKEDDQAGNDAPLYRADSSVGDRETPVGDAGFEAPKRSRTAAQVAAFKKARAARAANLAKKTKKVAPEPEPEPEPEFEPTPPPTAAKAAPGGNPGATRARGGAA